MKVLIIGLYYFSKSLAQEMNERFPGNKFLALNTYYSKVDQLKFYFHLSSADLVYSINGSLSNSRAFNLTMKANKPLMIQWAGTDVLTAKTLHSSGKADLKYPNYASNFTESSWLQDELSSIGIPSRKLLFTSIDNQGQQKFPSEFKILSYLGKNRSEFYGAEFILKLAQLYPQFRFLIIGESLNSNLENIENLGFVSDPYKAINSSVVHLRWTAHDSLANTVLESLSCGRYVVWKNKFPETFSSQDEKLAEKFLLDLYEKFNDNQLELNTKGIKLIENEFNKPKVLDNLLKEMEALI